MRDRQYIGLMVVLLGALGSQGFSADQQTSAVQTHIDHVMVSLQGTPNQQGLLPTALAEAKVAAQHAGLALKMPENLDALKLHAGHVIHALDPTLEAKGPGLGYGVKRAAAGVTQHIELAAKSEGSSDNVKTHAGHVSVAASTVVKRVDEITAMAQRVRAASSTAEASGLMIQINEAVQQLTSGVDANNDGRIGWQAPEGALQQAQQHMELLQKGEVR